jgi:hypothetical protein
MMLLPRGFAHCKKLGTKQMKIAGLQVEALDPQHALAKLHYIVGDEQRVCCASTASPEGGSLTAGDPHEHS